MTDLDGDERLALVPDHLIVWGDVERDGASLGRALGLHPADGGVHPGGTRNMIFALDDDRFLEVLGPDPDRSARDWGPRADHPPGTLWWWAARAVVPLEDVRRRLGELGVDTGEIEPGERIRPSGERVGWQTVDPVPEAFGCALPFVIRWEAAPPVRAQGNRCTLRRFRLVHPDTAALSSVVSGVRLDRYVEVVAGPAPGVVATVEGPAGTVELATP